jgi:hypothetical protein
MAQRPAPVMSFRSSRRFRGAPAGSSEEATMLRLVLVVAPVFAVGVGVCAVQNTAPVGVAFPVKRPRASPRRSWCRMTESS